MCGQVQLRDNLTAGLAVMIRMHWEVYMEVYVQRIAEHLASKIASVLISRLEMCYRAQLRVDWGVCSAVYLRAP